MISVTPDVGRMSVQTSIARSSRAILDAESVSMFPQGWIVGRIPLGLRAMAFSVALTQARQDQKLGERHVVPTLIIELSGVVYQKHRRGGESDNRE